MSMFAHMTTSTNERADLAGNVRAEVARRCIRQRVIADALGLDQRAVSRRLLGQVEWSATELGRLAELLDVDLNLLVAVPA